ncbi:MAG TPA: helix-turn-helix domain-containing protein [Chlamydiales bacterium]|nr:helix-turn-helix domain-containing protein [Chlamydiales bacterium]
MTILSKKKEPVLPKAKDIALAEEAIASMGKFFSEDSRKDYYFTLKKPNRQGAIKFTLTPMVVDLIFRTLVQIANGNAVTIVPYHAELTTQEAADFLNVSRPFLIQLLEKGKIHFRKVGRHRRVLFKDLIGYKERSKNKSHKIRTKLTEEAQDLDTGY